MELPEPYGVYLQAGLHAESPHNDYDVLCVAGTVARLARNSRRRITPGRNVLSSRLSARVATARLTLTQNMDRLHAKITSTKSAPPANFKLGPQAQN